MLGLDPASIATNKSWEISHGSTYPGVYVLVVIGAVVVKLGAGPWAVVLINEAENWTKLFYVS